MKGERIVEVDMTVLQGELGKSEKGAGEWEGWKRIDGGVRRQRERQRQ